ncbi:MAG: hypothetical protein M4579_001196 [Chaenotheca gracillima]|nr:MAG: hypothetical protein M4579_001196 [Chaenotheca gracillima]
MCKFAPRRNITTKDHTEHLDIMEEQQEQLVLGVRKLFSLLIQEKPFEGTAPRVAADGQPLVHDILKGLGILDVDSGAFSDPSEDAMTMVGGSGAASSTADTLDLETIPDKSVEGSAIWPACLLPQYSGSILHELEDYYPNDSGPRLYEDFDRNSLSFDEELDYLAEFYESPCKQ